MPTISVIITAYGCEEHIKSTLKSVRQQTFTDWEAVVIDDGSPDHVSDIVKQICSEDTRIRFIQTPNHGTSAARNYAIFQSSGEYILPLDGDDIIAPTYLEEAYTILRQNADVALAYCKWQFFGNNEPTPDIPYTGYRDNLVRNAIFNCAMFRRKSFDNIGGYDENMKFGYEDWEMWIRLLNPNQGGNNPTRVVQIPKQLFFYRQKTYGYNPKLNDSRMYAAMDYIYAKHRDLYRSYFGPALLMAQDYCTHLHYVQEKRRALKPKNLVKRLWQCLFPTKPAPLPVKESTIKENNI